jgi:hypothetical protein
MLCNIFK